MEVHIGQIYVVNIPGEPKFMAKLLAHGNKYTKPKVLITPPTQIRGWAITYEAERYTYIDPTVVIDETKAWEARFECLTPFAPLKKVTNV